MKHFLRIVAALYGVFMASIAGGQNDISFVTLNCYWFLDAQEGNGDNDKPRTTLEYTTKAGHLVGLLPKEAPLFVGFQEIGDGEDLAVLAKSATARYGRRYQTLFTRGKDTSTGHNVGAILDATRGWGVYGKPSRVSDLERELSKHLVVRLTNAVTSMDICVVHLRRPTGNGGVEKQRDQCRALLQWAMRHLSGDPKANLVIMGDFNEGQPIGSDSQALSVLFHAKPPMVDVLSKLIGEISTHADGKAYDRILVSEAMAKGLNKLRLKTVGVQKHGHDKGQERRLYTDHYPVTAGCTFLAAPSADVPALTRSEGESERVMLPVEGHTWRTCVGFDHTKPPPWTNGNCLTFQADASKLLGYLGTGEVLSWRILNIHAENFDEITKRLGIKLVEAEVFHKAPGESIRLTEEGAMAIQIVDQGDCVIIDPRIPRNWFRSAPCRSCFRDGARQKYVSAFPDKFNGVP